MKSVLRNKHIVQDAARGHVQSPVSAIRRTGYRGMATTFDVIHPGALPDLDMIEADDFAEGAATCQGPTFGGTGDTLRNDARANDFKTRKSATVPLRRTHRCHRAWRPVRYLETAPLAQGIPAVIVILPKGHNGANSGYGAS